MKTIKTTIAILSLLVISTLGFFYYRVYNAAELKDKVSFEVTEGNDSYADEMKLIGRGVVGDQYTGEIEIKKEGSMINRPPAPKSLYINNDPEYLELVKEYPHYYRGKENTTHYYQSADWIVNSTEFFDRFGQDTETTVEMTISTLNKESEEVTEGTVSVTADGTISYTSLEEANILNDIAFLQYTVGVEGIATTYIVQYDLQTGDQLSTVIVPPINNPDATFVQVGMKVLSPTEVLVTNAWKKPVSDEEADTNGDSSFFLYVPDQFVFQHVNLESGQTEILDGAETIRDEAEVIVISDGTIYGFAYSNGSLKQYSYDVASRQEQPEVEYPVNGEVFTSLGQAINQVADDGSIYLAESNLGFGKREGGIVVLNPANQEKVMEGVVTHEGNQLDAILFESFE